MRAVGLSRLLASNASASGSTPIDEALDSALDPGIWLDDRRSPKGEGGHENLNAGGHLAERPRPRKLPAGGHEICTPSR
jgi:hypothetical protein